MRSLILIALLLAPFAAADADAEARPGCPRQDHPVQSPDGATHRVEVAHNCRTTVTLNEGVTCPGWVERDEYELPGVTVVHHHCGDGGRQANVIPVCWGPTLAPTTIGPVTASIPYGVNCGADVSVDESWGPLPDEGRPSPWEGGVGVCLEVGHTAERCVTLASWTCLGGQQVKVIRHEVGPAEALIHHCVPGPNPGPAL